MFHHAKNNTMTLTFRMCQPFTITFGCLKKYQEQGFKLIGVFFDKEITPELPDIIISLINVKCKIPLLCSLLFHSPFGECKGAKDIVRMHLSKFLISPDDTQEIEEREQQIHCNLLLARANKRENRRLHLTFFTTS
jgi:hypothetical protein